MGIFDKLLRKKDEDVPDFGPAGADPFANDPFAPQGAPPPGMGPAPPGGMAPAAPPAFPAPQTDPFATAQQSYPLATTPNFPTPTNVPAQQQRQGNDAEMNMQFERINHRLDLISGKIGKIEQTLDFMQRYVYSNR